MDDSPCFSHLVMEMSLPTNIQQRPRRIAAPPKGTTLATDVPSFVLLLFKPEIKTPKRGYTEFLI